MTWIRYLAPILMFVGLCAPAQSYELEPIVIQLSAAGGGTVKTGTITNTHQEPIAIEIQIFQREQHPDGTETRTAEEDDIIVSPPQMVIPPGSSQSFKVRYIGDPAVTREKTYRLITEQLPIRLREEASGDVRATVSMKYRYEAALYVMPPERKPSYRLLGARPVEDEGKRFVELDIASEGNMRAILQQPEVILSTAEGEATLAGEAAQPLDGLNILAGNHRIVRLPWPEDLPFGDVEAALNARLLILQ